MPLAISTFARRGASFARPHLGVLALLFTIAGAASANGPSKVTLWTAGNYAILAKTGISTMAPSVVTGNIAASPVASTYLTDFSLIEDSTNTFWTSDQATVTEPDAVKSHSKCNR